MKHPGFALSAGVAIVVLAAGCSKSSSDSPAKAARSEAISISVAEVVTVPLDRTLPVVGTLYAKDEATIAAQVEGQVEKTLVDFGDRVTNNQVLARIDTASYEALARQAAANLAKAQATAANAAQDLKRIHDLQRDKIASASEFDKATAASEQAKAEVKAATAAEAIAQLNLERSRVKSPFDGAVAERIASAGDYMKTGESLFRLVAKGAAHPFHGGRLAGRSVRWPGLPDQSSRQHRLALVQRRRAGAERGPPSESQHLWPRGLDPGESRADAGDSAGSRGHLCRRHQGFRDHKRRGPRAANRSRARE